jgi:hypothetical protein
LEFKQMTMDKDNIELPPLPGEYYSFSKGEVHKYGRECYEAGLAAARAEQAQPANPTVHSARWELCGDGFARRIMLDARTSITNVTLCWTDDGRVWIDSERNRELARRLRVVAEVGYTAPTDAALRDAAAALDGGEG